MRTRRWGILAAALVFSAAAAGCSGTGTVSGKVYVGDKLVTGGTVQFVAKNGITRSAQIGTDGSYTVEKVPVGPAKIVVDNSALKPQQQPGSHGNTPPSDLPPEAANSPMYGGGGAQKGKWVPFDDKYTNPATTELELDVVKGDQEFEIHMK